MADDPYRAYNLKLLVDGAAAGAFVECSDLHAVVDTIAYREDNTRQQSRHLRGHIRYQPLTLRYGVSRSRALWNWLETSFTGGEQ